MRRTYYWFTSVDTGQFQQFSRLRDAKRAADKQKMHVTVWKYTPETGSTIVYETQNSKSL